MTVESQYPAQLIAMVTPETKAKIRAEADERKISISQVVRERLDRSMLTVPEPETIVTEFQGHAGEIFTTRTIVEHPDDDNASTLRDHVAGLTPDQDGDDVDGHLADTRADGQPNLRVAPRRPRGLT